MRRYKKRRVYEWSPELAYCAGLIASDGSLSTDNRHIDFTSTDYGLVETFKSIMCPHIKIGTKLSGAGRTAYRVQFGDIALYDFLISFGLTPHKSKTIGRLKIPDELYADFLRGCFDGDGSTYGFRDTRWKNSYMYYLTFCSASPRFLEWLQTQNTILAKTQLGSLQHRGDRISTLVYAKQDSKILHDFMYYDRAVPHLPRKMLKLQGFFATDPYL